MTADLLAQNDQIRRASDELLIAITSRPCPHADVAKRAIVAATKLATGDYKSIAVFTSIEG